jgi:anti-sigma B factor antagonist
MPDTAAPPILSLDVEQCPDKVAVVRCHGKLVAGVTDILIKGVRPLLSTNQRVVLDLSDLAHVASKNAGCSLELTHLSKQIRHLLGLTHLLDVFIVIGENRVKFM